jgi:hypothetical protein
MLESCDIAARRMCASAFEAEAVRRGAVRWFAAPVLAVLVAAGTQFALSHGSATLHGSTPPAADLVAASGGAIDPPAFVRTPRPLTDLTCPKTEVE